jgi:hypothetical protein
MHATVFQNRRNRSERRKAGCIQLPAGDLATVFFPGCPELAAFVFCSDTESVVSFFPALSTAVIYVKSYFPPTQKLQPLPEATWPPPIKHSFSVVAQTPDTEKRLTVMKHAAMIILNIVVFVIRFSHR